MTKRLSLLFLSLSPSLILAQTLNDFRSNVTTGNWATAGTWQVYNGSTWVVPGAAPTTASANTITILAGHTITVNATTSADQLVVNGILTIGTTRTLTIANGAGTDLQINTGGTISTASVTAGNLSLAASTTAIINGTLTNNSPSSITCNGILTNTGGTITNSSTLTFSATGTYQHNFTSAAGTIPAATWNASSICEILASNSLRPLGLNQAFGNFIWNNVGQTANIDLGGTLGASITGIGNPAIAGDFSLLSTGGFELQLKTSGTLSLTVGDSLKISSGILVLNAGTGAFGVTLTGKKGLFQTGGTVNLSSSSSSAGNGYLYVGNCFTHTGGTICETGSSVNSQISVNGSTAATIESIGFSAGNLIFMIQESGAAASTSILSGKNFIINSGTDFYVYDNGFSSADLTITGTLTANTNTWTFVSGVTSVNGIFLNNSLTIGNSSNTTLVFNTGGIFRQNVNGGQVAVASWMPTSTVEIVGITTCDSVGNGNQTFGNVTWNCPSQSSSASFGRASSTGNFTTQNDFTVTSTGTGKLRFPDFDFTIGNDLIVQNAATLQISYAEKLYSPSTRTVTIIGNVNILNTASLTVGAPNTGASLSTGDQYRDYVLSLKKNFVHSSTTSITGQVHKSYVGASNDEEYRLTLDYNNGITQYLTMNPSASGTNFIFTGDGNANSGTDDEFSYYNIYKISITNTGTHLKALSNLKYNTLTVGSTNTPDTLDMTSGTYNLVHFPSLAASGATQGGSTTISGNVSGSGVLDFGLGILTDDAGSGTFTLAALAELKTKHVDGITPVASGAVGCIRTGTRTYNAGANYTYNGTTAQVTGTGLPVTLTGILEIDNSTSLSSGGVTLSQATAINGGATMPLTFTTGKLITTATNLITINNGSVVSPAGGSATSFVDGPVSKVGFTNGVEFVYPTGDTAKWARIGFTTSATIAGLTYTAEYFKRDPHTNVDATFIDSTLDWTNIKNISYQEYWSLNRIGATAGNGKVKLYWESSSFSGINLATSTDLRVAHFKTAGPKWFAEGTLPTVTGSTIETQAVVTSVASYPFFTFGAPNSVNPLPIELLSFSGETSSNGNQLHWSTATETNNDYFDLERSADAETFMKIAKIEGNGNSSSVINYEKLDMSPANGINYYRLKQVDFNGEYIYSSVIAIDNNNNNNLVIAYPNPTTGNEVTLALTGSFNEIVVYNILGEIVYQRNNLENIEKVRLELFSKGVYIVKATAGNEVITSKFTKN